MRKRSVEGYLDTTMRKERCVVSRLKVACIVTQCI